MMSSFTEFTYQHTCKPGRKAYILKSAPFSSPVRKKDGKLKIPFLGSGYYLWEENTEAAIRWGKDHYKNKYCIVEYKDLKIHSSELLDFLNRRDIQYFKELKEIYLAKRPKSKDWKIGQWIEFFKMVRKKDGKTFPFNYIRAEENLPDPTKNNRIKEKELFSDDSGYFTFLSPLLIICIIDKSKIKFKAQKIL